MADQDFQLDFEQVPGLSTQAPQSSLLPGTTISAGPERSLFQKAVDALPKHLTEGLFGNVNPNTGVREGGVTETFFGGLRKVFSPQRTFEERRNTLLSEGFTPEQSSDIAFRVVSGQSLDSLDEETKRQLQWDDRVDKGFAALDLTGIGIGKGIGLGVGFMSRVPIRSSAGALFNRFFGNLIPKRKAAEVVDETLDATDAILFSRNANKAKEVGEVSTDLKKAAEGSSGGRRALDEMTDMFNDAQPTLRKNLNEAPKKASNFYKTLRTEWTDRFTPIKNLVTKVETSIGRNINFGVDPYVAARLYQGANGKIQNTLDDLGAAIKKAGNFNTQGQNNLSLFLASQRMAERASRGIKNPRNITQEQAEAAAKMVETPEIKEAAAGIKNITDDLLARAEKSGIISKAAFNSIKQNNQNYVPFDVIQKMDDDIDNVNRAAGGFSVAEQNVVKSLQGTDKDIADPLEALTRKIIQSTKLIERNEVAKKVANLAKIDGVEDIKKFDKDTPLEAGNDVFHTYENGQKVSYQAPKDVIEAMKGMNSQELDMVSGIIGKTNEVFKGGVTTFNIAFQIPNAIIDFFDAMLIAKNRINVIDWSQGFASAVGKGKLYRQWREDGGAFSTYISQARSARMTVDEISSGTARKTIKSIMNPLRLLEWMGSVAEETNRLAVYRRALKAGEGRDFAAYESRQASVDFARYGNRMRIANQWVPFLNARLQGSLNLARVSKERPQRTALRLAFLVAAPQVATYLHNRQYPEFQDIPQWEKDANFIIMTGSWQNKDGNSMPSYVKIPKGHIGRLVANPVENFMVFQDSGDATEWDKLALQSVSNVLPADIARDGELSLPAFMNTILPPAVKTPIEVEFANKSFFTEQNIVPRSLEEASSENQARANTTDLAKDLGQTELAKTLGLSPAGMDHYVSGLFGTLGRDVVNLIDTARGEGIWLDEDLERDKRVSKIPVVSRFIGFRGGNEQRDTWDTIDQLRTEAADRRVGEQQIAEEIYETIRVADATAVASILKEYEDQGELTDGVERRLKTMLKEKAKNIDAVDRSIKALPTDERAKYVLSVIRDTPNDQLPLRLKEFEDKGILTEAVEEDIKRLLTQE